MRTLIKDKETLETLKEECLDYCNYVEDMDVKMTCEVEIRMAKTIDELAKVEVFKDAVGTIFSNNKDKMEVL